MGKFIHTANSEVGAFMKQILDMRAYRLNTLHSGILHGVRIQKSGLQDTESTHFAIRLHNLLKQAFT